MWFNDLDQIKCDTLLHAAKRAGLTTAVSSWPMTSGGEEFIDYLYPNVLDFYFEGIEEDILGVYRSLGAGDNVIDIIEENNKIYGHNDRHPSGDYKQFAIGAEIIKRYKPGLLLMHPGNVDAARHKDGVHGEHVKNALREIDEMLGRLLDAVREAGIEELTDIVLLSDHGQIGVTRMISPNVYLRNAGYITLGEAGELKEWSAFAKQSGGSAQVYLKDPDNKEVFDGVYKLFSDMASEGIYGFERVLTAEEARREFGLYGGFSFVLETDGYTGFSERLVGAPAKSFDFGDYTLGRGKHGHMPNKGPQPVFIAKGPSFKKNVIIPRGNILNHAATLAAALGVELLDSEGSAVREILE